jgi:two-component system, NarL family, sensor histidine kinase FusK
MNAPSSLHRSLRSFGHGFDLPSVNELSFCRENILPLLIVSGADLLSGSFSRLMAIPDRNIGALWLPAGVGVASVVLKGKRAILGIVLGATILNLISMRSVLLCLSIGVFSAFEAMFGAWLAKGFANIDTAFANPTDYLKFVFLSGVLNGGAFAIVGTSILCLGRITPPGEFWLGCLRWSSGDMIGIALVAPFLILLFRHKPHSFDFQGAAEIVGLLVAIIIVCCLSFGTLLPARTSNVGIQFFCIPLLLWTSVRFCPLEACGAALLVGCFAMWGSLNGYGPFGSPIAHSVLRTCFVLVVTILTVTVSVAWAQLQKQLEDMVFLNVALQEKLKRQEMLINVRALPEARSS